MKYLSSSATSIGLENQVTWFKYNVDLRTKS